MAIKNTPEKYREKDADWMQVPCRIDGCETLAGVAGLCQKHRRQGAEFVEKRRTMARGLSVQAMIEILQAFDGDAELNKIRFDDDVLTVGTGATVEEFQVRTFKL